MTDTENFEEKLDRLIELCQRLKRDNQALHARELGLVHPATGEQMLFEAPWPEDFVQLVQALRDERRSHL